MKIGKWPRLGRDATRVSGGQDSGSELQDMFGAAGQRGQGMDYRPVALWKWNARLEEREIRRQVRALADAGLSGAMVVPDTGLESPFLGEDWLNALEAAVDEARRTDLGMWLQVGCLPPGVRFQVSDPTPEEKRGQILRLENLPFPDTRFPESPPRGEFSLALFSGKLRDGKLTQLQRLHFAPTDSSDAGATPSQQSDGPAGTALSENPPPPLDDDLETVLIHCYREPTGSTDWLDPEAAQRFFRSIHEVYYREFGEVFARTIRALYLEAPSLSSPPWSPALASVYQEMRTDSAALDILDLLASVFFETPDQPESRYLFWRTVSEAFSRSCARPLRQWCENRDILFTGDYPGDGSLQMEIASTGGLMPQYVPTHVPGAAPVAGSGGADKITQTLLAKQAASVSRQMGGRRTLGHLSLDDWITGPAELRHRAAILAALGIDQFCLDRALSSIQGPAKEQASLLIQPWWSDFPKLSSNLARLLFLMNQGHPVVDVAVLYPLGSAWQRYRPDQPTSLDDLAQSLREVTDSLLAVPCDFDLLDEGILASRSAVESTSLRVGSASYRAVVLPAVTGLAASTLDILDRFLGSGGLVVCTGALPGFLDGSPSDRPAEVLARAQHISGSGELADVLSRTLGRAQIQCSEGRVIYQHRDAGRYQFLLLANCSTEVEAEVEVALQGEGRLESWDCETGRAAPIDAHTSGSRVSGRVQVPTGGYTVVGLDLARPPWKQENQPADETTVIEMNQLWKLTLREPNVLVIDHCSYKLDAGEWQPDASINEIRSRLHSSEARGMLLLRLVIDLARDVDRRDLSLVVEDAEKWSILINGRPLSDRDSGSWIDPSFRKFDVSKLLQPGRNILLFTARSEFPLPGSSGRSPSALSNMYLLGHFAVEPPAPSVHRSDLDSGEAGSEVLRTAPGADAHPFVLLPLPVEINGRDLGMVGLPFFTGTAYLQGSVELPRGLDGPVFLEMDKPEASAVSVRVNQKDAGTLMWYPYSVEITSLVRPGKNTITLGLTSSGANLLQHSENLASVPPPQLGVGAVRVRYTRCDSTARGPGNHE